MVLLETTPPQRRALTAAALGWMLDSMDFMMYSLVLAYLMKDLAMSKSTAGLLGSAGQLSGAAGRLLFGVLAARLRPTRAPTRRLALHSLSTAASRLSH